MSEQYLLDLQEVTVEYDYQGQHFAAVEDVSFGILKGETLGLVGESGCGKSSIGKSIIQLPPPTKGKILFEGKQLNNLSNRALQRIRHNMQIIFQDPIASLNPRRKVRNILSEPLIISGVKEKKEIEELGKQLAMQIAATSPLSIDKDDLDVNTLKKEKEIIKEELKNTGKDSKIIDKIADGKLNKFINDNTLLNQEWIMEPKKKVKDVIKEFAGKEKFLVKSFTRFKVGEGL